MALRLQQCPWQQQPRIGIVQARVAAAASRKSRGRPPLDGADCSSRIAASSRSEEDSLLQLTRPPLPPPSTPATLAALLLHEPNGGDLDEKCAESVPWSGESRCCNCGCCSHCSMRVKCACLHAAHGIASVGDRVDGGHGNSGPQRLIDQSAARGQIRCRPLSMLIAQSRVARIAARCSCVNKPVDWDRSSQVERAHSETIATRVPRRMWPAQRRRTALLRHSVGRMLRVE